MAYRPWLRGAPLLLGIVSMTVLVGASGFREDEVKCDHAVAHLLDCCKQLDPYAFDCTYGEGCDGAAFAPDLSVTESDCIRSLSCAEIRDASICERAQAVGDRPDTSEEPVAREAVCP